MDSMLRKGFFGLLVLAGCACLGAVPEIKYTVVAEHPHDPEAWTQGLFYEDGFLYESTGIYGKSSIRKVEIETGKVLRKRDLRMSHFGEGMTIRDGKLYQLTWLSRLGFVYDKESFEPLGEFEYFGEGWGLTHDDKHLILSDGTAKLRFLSPETFKLKKIVEVKDGNGPVVHLNELEYIDGFVYANVWYTNQIVKIDPASGRVVGRLNLERMFPDRPRNEDAVLNGIAYAPKSKILYVTGKYWPKLFAIKLD